MEEQEVLPSQFVAVELAKKDDVDETEVIRAGDNDPIGDVELKMHSAEQTPPEFEARIQRVQKKGKFTCFYCRQKSNSEYGLKQHLMLYCNELEESILQKNCDRCNGLFPLNKYHMHLVG